jgi:outer membrane immunogenic protein
VAIESATRIIGVKLEANFVNSSALLAAAAAMAASTGSAGAADLYQKARPVSAPAPSWEGLYVGGSVGASWLNSTLDDSGANVFGAYYGGSGLSQNANALGFIGGLQAGYNWQSRNFVYGLEGDFSWIAGGKASANGSLVDYSGYATNKTSRVDALATFRARFGIDMGGTLPYLTAGLAVGHIKNSYTLTAPAGYGAGGAISSSKSSWEPGIVIGGGIEHQFSNSRWSVKGEVLWVGFKDTHYSAPAAAAYYAGTQGTVSSSNNMTIGRLGLYYRF